MNNEKFITPILFHLQNTTDIKGFFNPNLNSNVDEVNGTLDLIGLDVKLPKFNVEIKGTFRQYQLLAVLDKAAKFKPFMLVAENIFPDLKAELRKRKINYLDAAGNLFIQEGKTTLWFDGKKKPSVKKGNNRAFTKAGLKVIFHFLQQEDVINQPYRQIAESSGVALGSIKSVLDGLQQAGYLLPLTKDKFKLTRKKELLQRWIDGYGEILRPALQLARYRFLDSNKLLSWQQLPFDPRFHAWSGEAGGDLLTQDLRPEKLQIYSTKSLDLVEQWKLLPDDQGPVEIFQPFWKEVAQVHMASLSPMLIIYADLILANNPRCTATAVKIYNKYLKNGIE